MHTLTKTISDLLQQLSKLLPIVKVNTKELHWLTGEEILSWGTITEIEGEPIIPGQIYRWHYPVILIANHSRRLRKRFEKNGIEGVKGYLNWINSLVKEDKMKKTMQALMLLIKTIEENK